MYDLMHRAPIKSNTTVVATNIHTHQGIASLLEVEGKSGAGGGFDDTSGSAEVQVTRTSIVSMPLQVPSQSMQTHVCEKLLEVDLLGSVRVRFVPILQILGH